MTTIIIISLVVLLLGLTFLGFISPYSTDTINIVRENTTEPHVIEKIVEVEKIIEVPVEKIVEVEKEVIKTEIVEDLNKINELTEKIKQLESIKNSTIYRNIGLELFEENNLANFTEKINSIVGKNILIVTDSNYVLGANFSGYRTYKGTLLNYDILEGRYPDQPIIQLNIDVPVLPTSNINLKWIFDKYKFNSTFSNDTDVNEYLKTGNVSNNLFLVEI